MWWKGIGVCGGALAVEECDEVPGVFVGGVGSGGGRVG
jgi:hypothetical protein